jgi:hypothetical protein
MKNLLKFIHSLLIYFLFAVCLIINACILVDRLSNETKPIRTGVFYVNSDEREYISRLELTQITKKEYEEASGINVIKDCSIFGLNKCYKINAEIQGEELVEVQFVNLRILDKNTNNWITYIDENGNMFSTSGDYYHFFYGGTWFY